MIDRPSQSNRARGSSGCGRQCRTIRPASEPAVVSGQQLLVKQAGLTNLWSPKAGCGAVSPALSLEDLPNRAMARRVRSADRTLNRTLARDGDAEAGADLREIVPDREMLGAAIVPERDRMGL